MYNPHASAIRPSSSAIGRKAASISAFPRFSFSAFIFALLLTAASSSFGQAFSGNFSFSGTNGDNASLAYNGSAIANLTVSALTKNGVTNATNSGNFRATNFATGSTNGGAAGGSIDTAKYFEFTITADAGYTLSNPSLNFGVGRSATGPRRFQWRSSVDNFANPMTVGTIHASVTNSSNVMEIGDVNTNYTGNNVSITSSGNSSITFRFYPYGAEATSGTGGLAASLTFNATLNAPAIAPTLTTPSKAGIATTSATLGATVTSNGGAALSARGTVWGTAAAPTGNSLAEGGTTVSAFTHSRTSLTANTLYYYRGYATNSAGTSYSADDTFTTLPLPPTVGTGSSPTATGFTANWSLPTMGSATHNFTVEVSTNNSTFANPTTVTGILSGNTTQAITGLSPSTTYYYRIKSVNAQGDSAWSSGSAGIATSAAAGPVLTAATLGSALTSTYPSASSGVSFTTAGTNLTENILVTAQSGYEVSTSSGSGYGASVSVATGTTVYVRFAASRNAGDYNSATAAVLSSAGAANANVTTSSSGNTISNGTPPTLTANATATVDGAFVVTFADNATWRGQISSITVGGTILTAGYTVAAGTITFTPSASSPANLLQTSGSKAIIVNASNYAATTSLSQTINPGAATKLSVTTQPAAPASNGAALATQPVITIQDQYNNTVTGSSASVTAAVGSGTWTLGGTTVVNAISGVATFSGLTATSAAAVTGATINFTATSLTSATSSTFNIPAPVLDYVSLTAIGTNATENFDTLANTGTSSTLPQGWAISEAGGSSDSTYASGTGSDNIGNSYSFGAVSSSERALGGLRSSNVIPSWGAKIRNNTGQTITNLDISYSGEQWRLGATGRPDTLTFQYSTDATSLTTGNWTTVAGLAFTAPVSSGTIGSLNGNASGNRTTVNNSITEISVAPSGNFWIRWQDNDATGSDDGLGIDDVSIIGLGNATLTIGGSSANATSADFSTTYGTASANQTFTIGGSSLQGNVTATAGTGFQVSSDGTTYGATATFTRNATYAASGTLYARLTATASANTAYTLATVATLTSTNAISYIITTDSSGSTVSKATPTISVAPTASAITYGQALSASTITPGTASAGTYAFASPATTPAVGTASQSITFTPTDSGNYTTASTSASVTVNQAALTITGIAIANKTYDGTTSATITGTAAYSGLVLGQSFGVTGIGSATFGNATVGSSKPVTVTGYTAPNGNYSISQPTGLTANITTASVTVTAGNQTKTFGASDPALTYTPSPALIAGNSFTGALSRAAGSGVGTYAISQGTLSAGSNYTITFVGANLTITQATPTISVAPTASNITIGQTLANSTLSGGTASVAGAFAFTTPATAPALGISSQGVTFTPNDSGNYTTQTTSVDVGVLCLAPTFSQATLPISTGFTVNWNAATGAGNYTVLHSASKNMTGATSVNTASTTLALTGLSEGLRFVQVRANNAAGASANSTTQVNQLQSVAAGATKYVSLASAPSAQTVAGIFGSANESGLAAGATDSNATTILLLNSDGSTANTIFYDTDVNEWREGASDMGSTAIAAGKAFMLKNNTGSTDYFLLVGTPREGGSQPAVSLSSAGNFTLLTTGRTSNTTLTDLNLNPGTGAGQFKAASKPSSGDRLIVPPVVSTDPVTSYWYHTGSGQWYDGLSPVPSASIPAGQGFFIKRAPDSTFSTWTMPAE